LRTQDAIVRFFAELRFSKAAQTPHAAYAELTQQVSDLKRLRPGPPSDCTLGRKSHASATGRPLGSKWCSRDEVVQYVPANAPGLS
jgi:hypothetical protein